MRLSLNLTPGSGTFMLKADVHLNGGTVQRIRERLRFSRSEPVVYVAASSDEEEIIASIKEVMGNMHVSVTSSQDVEMGDDLASSIRDRIDRSKAVILLGGQTPSRWLMREVELANALGKPIVSIGPSPLYDTKGGLQIDSLEELRWVLDKLPE